MEEGLERSEIPVLVLILSLLDEISLLARTLFKDSSYANPETVQNKPIYAGELESELGLRLNTLKYNLDVMQKAVLIKIGQVKWSCKGREVKIYNPAERPALLVHRAKENDSLPAWMFWKKTLENCWKYFQGMAINLSEESGKNNSGKNIKHITSDKKHNDKEAFPAHC